jgi:hypothetical protein
MVRPVAPRHPCSLTRAVLDRRQPALRAECAVRRTPPRLRRRNSGIRRSVPPGIPKFWDARDAASSEPSRGRRSVRRGTWLCFHRCCHRQPGRLRTVPGRQAERFHKEPIVRTGTMPEGLGYLAAGAAKVIVRIFRRSTSASSARSAASSRSILRTCGAWQSSASATQCAECHSRRCGWSLRSTCMIRPPCAVMMEGKQYGGSIFVPETAQDCRDAYRSRDAGERFRQATVNA